jgi:DUF1680 family protein
VPFPAHRTSGCSTAVQTGHAARPGVPAALEPTGCCTRFRAERGLPSSAAPLGGGKAPDVELRGHTAGHYLSALALMYAATGDARFKTRADGMVSELAAIQDALANGSTRLPVGIPEGFFDRVETRQKVWAPYYTIHKIMAGLLDVHQLAGNAQALGRRVEDGRLGDIPRRSAHRRAAAGGARHGVRRHERSARQYLRGDRQPGIPACRARLRPQGDLRSADAAHRIR